MRVYLKIFLIVLIVLIARQVATRFGANTDTPEQLTIRQYGLSTTQRYSSLPKGVVLEGSAVGFEPLKSIQYDKKNNEFTINDNTTYSNPIDRREFLKILQSLRKDDRIGVTLISGDPHAYGSLPNEDKIVNNFSGTDRLMGGIIYGKPQFLNGTVLPGGYVPKQAENRTIAVVAFTNFNNYRFEKNGSKYVRVDNDIQVTLIPLSEKKAENGGHLPDEEKIHEYVIESTDRDNLEHLQKNKSEYFKIPILAGTVRYGEAAAFARILRDSGIKLDALIKMLQ